MSNKHDDIPFDIQAEIIKRIRDVKSLIRFRSVSKPWKSLIDNSKFISAYKSTNHHIYQIKIKRDCSFTYCWIDDDNDDDYDSYPKYNLPVALPNSFEKIFDPVFKPQLLGSSHGLLCFYGFKRKKVNKYVVVVWNPSIRKLVTIHVPNMDHIGFGVCRRTSDPKLVNIKNIYDSSNRSKNPPSADIFTLNSGVWRSLSIDLTNISATSLCDDDPVVIDGTLYWHATTKNDNGIIYNRIITFDLTNEEFGEVCLPYRLATTSYLKLFISKRNESLVVLEYYNEPHHDTKVCDVWMMERDGLKLFKKLFTIDRQVYFECSYTETLLLLDRQSDS